MPDLSNYEAVVPEALRDDVQAKILRACDERVLHADGTNLVRSLVMEAYAAGLKDAEPVFVRNTGYEPTGRSEPAAVFVHVPGVPYESEDGNTGSCDWPATIVKGRDPHANHAAYALPERFPDVARRELARLADGCIAEHSPAQDGCIMAPTETVAVAIAGLPRTVAPGGADVYGWLATRAVNEWIHNGTVPVYNLQGDVNAVAVGRFKSSLRKFLGI